MFSTSASRSAATLKAPAPAPATRATEGTDPGAPFTEDALKLNRRSWKSGGSRSPTSSESGMSPRASDCATAPRQAVVIEQQGMGKVVHRPDGTVVWEPSADANSPSRRAPEGRSLRDTLVEAAVVSGGVVLAMGAIVGMAFGGIEVMNAADAARKGQAKLSTKQLTMNIATAVTATVAGSVTGAVLAPVAAVRILSGILLRPVIIGCAAHQVVGRVMRWRRGVEGVLAKLASGDSSKIMEALRHIIAQAIKRNPRFCKEFCKLAGMEQLLQLLADALPDCPWLHMLAQALAELAKDVDCREALLAAGGVPRLVALLRHPSPSVQVHALAGLATLADHPLAQDALRDAGGLERLLEMTAAATAAAKTAAVLRADATAAAAAAAPAGSSTGSKATTANNAAAASAAASAAAAAASARKASAAMLAHAVRLLGALALSDPANKASLGAAGGVVTLLDVVRCADAKSDLQASAVAALHNLLRGSPANQRALAALPAASEVLAGALAGVGPCWAPVKGDLHALLNVLARTTGAQESSGFVVIQGAVAGLAPN